MRSIPDSGSVLLRRWVLLWGRVVFAALLLPLLVLQPQQASAQTLTATASLATARSGHTATLLLNGQVLVTGGYNGSFLASAELYNPATHSWSSAGSMASARYAHTATLLPNGLVLVVGGYNSSVYPANAELYNPSTNTWSSAGSLHVARSFHSMTLLANGQVLVAGGYYGTYLNSAELYNPATNAWTVTGSLATGRYGHSATLMQNGSVLAVAGASTTDLSSTEIYNPTTGTWSAAAPIATARINHAANLLPSGLILVTGGLGGSGTLVTGQIYNPGTNTWATAGALNTSREDYTSTLLPSGAVVAVGGYYVGSTQGVLTNTEQYSVSGNTWTAGATLVTPRYLHTATLLPSGLVLLTGGVGSAGYLASSEVLDPSSSSTPVTGNLFNALMNQTGTLLLTGDVLTAGGIGSSTLATSNLFDPQNFASGSAGTMVAGRSQHTATLLANGQVLAVGGLGGTATPLASAELFTPTTGPWPRTGSWAATGAPLAARYAHTATLLPNGRVLVAGGNGASAAALSTAEVYDPTSGTWSATGPMNNARAGHTATLLPSGLVLVSGGTGTASTALATAELYNPATGTWTLTANLGTARYQHTATLLPNGLVVVAGGVGPSGSALASAELFSPAQGSWVATGSLTYARADHTATLLPTGRLLVIGGSSLFVESYNQDSGTWVPAGNLQTYRQGNTATLLPMGTVSGSVLIMGGYGGKSGFGNCCSILKTLETFASDWSVHSWQPYLSSVPASVTLGGEIALTGSSLTGSSGIEEASGGNGVQNSPTNYPVTVVQRIDNGQQVWLGADAAIGYTDSSLTTAPISGIAPGPAMLTTFVNGLPAISSGIVVTASQTISFPPIPTEDLGVASFPVTVTASSGLAVTLTSTSPQVCTVTGNLVTLVASGTCTIVANQAGNSTYAPAPTVTQTFVVTDFPALIGAPIGNGVSGFSGSGGPASAASLATPYGVALDAAGNIYVADAGDDVVWKVQTNGTISVFAGTGVAGYGGDGGPATAAQLNVPLGITVDAAGNVYFADSNNMVVRRVSTTGIITTVAGNGSETENGDGGPATSAGLIYPRGVAFDSAGNLYIADDYRVRKVAATGVITTVAGNGVSGTGTVPFAGDGGPATSAPLNGPAGILIDAAGNLYVADSGDQRVRKVSATGIITTIAGGGTGGDGGPATAASLNTPVGLALDSAGSLFIADNGTNTVRMVSASGIISTVVGNGSAGYSGNGGPVLAAALNQPSMIALDSVGDLYIADSGNSVVREAFGIAAPGNATVTTTNAVILSGQAATLGVSYLGSGTPSYQWYQGVRGSTALPISGARGATYVTPVLTSSTTYWVQVTLANGVTEASATITVTVLQPQQISFSAPGNQTLGTGPLALSATASSGLTVVFTSTTPTVCTVSGSTATLLSAGTCTIAANQSGSATYAAAPQVTQSFTVAQAAQSINFPAIPAQTLTTSSVTISAAATSGLPVSFATQTPSVCTVAGSVVSLLGAGTCTLTASQAGSTIYAPAPQVTQSFTVGLASQTIAFAAIGAQMLSTGTVAVAPVASSGLPVLLTSQTSATCSVNGYTISLVATGICTIAANQAGNAVYAPALPVLQSFSISSPQAQTISFPAIGAQTFGSAPFTVSVSASSGLPVTLSSLTSATCSVSAVTVTLLATGTCTLQATQSGNASYAAATPVSQSFSISTGTGGGNSAPSSDGPLPLWAYAALGGALVGIGRRRMAVSRGREAPARRPRSR